MTIAELFVNLSVKGGEKASEQMGKVKSGLESIQSSGLAAKAAVIAVVYAIERMTMGAAASGNELRNIGTLTGINLEILQRYGAVAMDAGASVEDMNGSFQSMQKILADMHLNASPNVGFQTLMRAGLLSPEMMAQPEKHVEDIMAAAFKYLKSPQAMADPAMANNIMSSLGLNSGAIVAGRFKESINDISKSRIFTPDQLKQQQDVYTNFQRLEDQFKKFSAKNIMPFGAEGIKMLSGALKEVDGLVKAFERLSEHYAAVKYIAEAVVAIGAVTFAPLTASIIALIAVLDDLHKGEKGYIGKTMKWRDEIDEKLLPKKLLELLRHPVDFIMDAPAGRKLPTGPHKKEGGDVGMNVEQNLYFQHPGENAQETGTSTRVAIQSAFRQLSTQVS